MKTRKLVCLVTGKSLLPTAEYYGKKLEKAGSEEILHSTYICKEAKDLLVKGLAVKEVRKMLKVTEELPDVAQTIIDELVTNEFGLKRSTMFLFLSRSKRHTRIISLSEMTPSARIRMKSGIGFLTLGIETTI